MKKIYYIFLLFPLFFNAQILDKYPRGQEFYKGGMSKLYSDIHQIIVDNKIQPCENDKELYRAKLLLTKEGEIKFVKDPDTIDVAENKCAHDLAKNIAGYLKNNTWNAAEVKGQKFSSIVELLIYPNDLFKNYRRGYNPYQFYQEALPKEDAEKFGRRFNNTFHSLFADYNLSGQFYLDFYIDKDGEIVSPSLQPEVSSQTFKNEVFRTLRRLNHKWNPATLNGVPIKSKISIPLGFTTTYYEE